ncbi:MAG: hypothetical protein H6R17_3090 [Proteobacteria bacterium]|nr:hypothetical protein [Pseudomonadota bacterium]
MSEDHFYIFVMVFFVAQVKNTVNKFSVIYSVFVFITRNHEATTMMIINFIMQIFVKSKKIYREKAL